MRVGGCEGWGCEGWGCEGRGVKAGGVRAGGVRAGGCEMVRVCCYYYGDMVQCMYT